MFEYRLYGVWNNMRNRCYNSKLSGFKNYGGRGITVCDEWKNDLTAFIDYVTQLPHYSEPSMTLDRERNNEGYKPGNMRWTTRHIQNTNSRRRKDNTSGYAGVSYNKVMRGWRSGIKINRKRIDLGHYDTPQEAAQARNQYIIKNNLTEYAIQTV